LTRRREARGAKCGENQSQARRTREIGIRTALGAGRAEVLLLFGIAPHDVSALAGAAAALGLTALAVDFLPATRAARANPLVALRHD
jgi:hypothetical protein